jgi:hypothetical protein
MMLASWGWAGKSIGGASVAIFRGNEPGNDGIVRFRMHHFAGSYCDTSACVVGTSSPVVIVNSCICFFFRRGLRSDAHTIYVFRKAFVHYLQPPNTS